MKVRTKEVKEIGYESVKIHSRIYKVIGYKKSLTNNKATIDKNFVELKELHLASNSMVTNLPIKDKSLYNNPTVFFDPLKKIKADLQKEWKDEYLDLLPGFTRKDDEWINIIPTVFSNKDMTFKVIVKNGIMIKRFSGRRIGVKQDVVPAFQNIKTLEDFINHFDESFAMQLKKNL